jgi:hypothetical protein
MKNSTVLRCSSHSLVTLGLLNYVSALLKVGVGGVVEAGTNYLGLGRRDQGPDYVAYVFVLL